MTDMPGPPANSGSPANASLAENVVATVTRLRQEQRLTLEELADRAGMHRTSLGLVQRGERGLSLASAERLADALGLPLSGLVALAENFGNDIPEAVAPRSPRRLGPGAIRDEAALRDLTGLDGDSIRFAIEYVYDTLDLIDSELLGRGSEPIAGLVELANLSSMIGNLVGAGVAEGSKGQYIRNKPHTFPDLVPQKADLPDLEIKTALEKNSPKGHLPKPGVYLTFRYVLGAADGGYVRKSRGKTAWIWEVRAGTLGIDDFSISNTAGDSGKTAVVKTESFKSMALVMQDDRFQPYARPWGSPK